MGFLSRFLLAVGTLFLFFAGAAHFVDPRGDFGGRRFLQVTMDSRMEKMRLFEAYAASGKVGGLILGSSRSMKIDPKELERRLSARFFNFSVDSARAEDYLAIYRWARRYGNLRISSSAWTWRRSTTMIFPTPACSRTTSSSRSWATGHATRLFPAGSAGASASTLVCSRPHTSRT